MDEATRARLAHCLEYHDTGSPTEAEVAALWQAYKALEAELTDKEARRRAWEIVAENNGRLVDQAAPVLAAAEAWADELPMETGEAGLHLMAVVLGWRAARGE